MDNIENAHPKRNVGFLLGCGIFLFPYLFSWLTLREGHSDTARIISFAWLALLVFVYIAGPKSGLNQNRVPASVAVPSDETSFIQIVAEAQSKSSNAENDMQRWNIKTARERCRISTNVYHPISFIVYQ